MSRRRSPDPPFHGILLVDKPQGLTSHDVVAQVRRILGVRKVGHAGTLDPLATGLLPVLVGQATRLFEWSAGDDKEYLTMARLGVRTDTLDAEGTVTHIAEVPPDLAPDTIESMLAALRGSQSQRVPRYSAVRVEGRRLHERARAGDTTVDAPVRQVTIHALDLLSFLPPHLTLRVACSKGTYVRQLVSDLGDALGCGAHVETLRRTRSGPLHLSEATPLADLQAAPQASRARMISMASWAARTMACVPCDQEAARRTRMGQRPFLDALAGLHLAPGVPFALLAGEDLVALAEALATSDPPGDPAYRLLRVFPELP